MEYVSFSTAGRARIGLISDTHLYRGSDLTAQIDKAFKDVDLILHAGDIYDHSVLDRLEQIAPVLAAEGDDDSLKNTDKRVKDSYSLNLGGLTLWLEHRMPWGLIRLLNSGTEAELVELVRSHCVNVPDIIVFGDTHMPLVRHRGGTLFVNPGSPTEPNHSTRPGTLAILTIASRKVEIRLVQLD